MSGQLQTCSALTSVPTEQQAKWSTEQVSTCWRREELRCLSGKEFLSSDSWTVALLPLLEGRRVGSNGGNNSSIHILTPGGPRIDINPSDRTMALGSTQPLTEMSTRIIPGGKWGRCVRLTTYHHPVPLSSNLGTLTSWNPLGHPRPVTGLLYLYILTPAGCFMVQALSSLSLTADTWFRCLAGLRGICFGQNGPVTIILLRSMYFCLPFLSVSHYKHSTVLFHSPTIDNTSTISWHFTLFVKTISFLSSLLTLQQFIYTTRLQMA
jgi:hypothetical protein